VNELIPTGKLRAGIVFAPKMSGLFVIKDANGDPQGITADLSRGLAKEFGVPVEFSIAPNSGLVTDLLAAGDIDVSFMPVDEERKKRIDFGPYYCMIESTYMVTGPSGLKTLADVDQPGVRVVGIANTTTIRASERSLKNTQPIAAGHTPTRWGVMRCRRWSRNFPARASSTAASSRPASPSLCRRASRRRWPM
jgi:polar amino acid transport system substrate-binding protein